MSNIQEQEACLIGLIDSIEDFHKLFGGLRDSHGVGYHLKQMRGLYAHIRKLLPADVGDRVVLVKTVECKGGWKPFQHVMVEGATAVVNYIEFHADSGFSYYLQFENETWIDSVGNANEVKDKHVFGLGARYFKRIDVAKEPTK